METKKHVINPFFGNTKTHDECEEELSQTNFYKYFDKIYIVLPICKPKLEWLNKFITEDNLNDLYQNCMVIVRKSSIGKINIFYEWMKTISKEKLYKLKSGSINLKELPDKVMILPFFILPLDNMIGFLNMYDEKDWLETFLINHKLTDYLKISKNFYELKDALETSPTTYWCKYNNCKINTTEQFLNRNFRWNVFKSEKDPTKIKTIEEMKNFKLKEDGYISMFFKSQGLFDNKFNTVNFKLHRLPKIKKLINTEQFNNILTEVSHKNRFKIFMNALVSPDYCHLILNNGKVWDIMSNMLERCLPVLRYALFYSYTSLYLQEIIKKTRLTRDDTCILKLDNACKIQNFPYLQSDINSHPGLAATSLLKQNYIPKDNFYGLANRTNELNELNNTSEFKSKLNIFLTGCSDKNILEYINFDNIHITGSVLTACIPKNPQLVNLFKKHIPDGVANSDDYIYHRYYNEYYANSDVDVLININNPINFYKKVIEFKKQLEQGIATYNGLESIEVNMDTIRKGYFGFNNAFLEKKLIPYWKEKGENITSKFIIENMYDSSKVYKYFKHYYDEKKKDFYEQFITNTGYDDIAKEYPFFFSDIKEEDITFNIYENINGKNYKVYQQDFGKVLENPPTDEEIYYNVVESTKYKLNSGLLNHPFELFTIPQEDPWSCINKFHMAPVRGYYDGKDVYLTISAVIAFQTMLSPDYRILFGSKDPVEICNKYRMRGFGVLLNKNELAQTIEYSSRMEFWKRSYNLEQNNTNSIKLFLGFHDINHNFYKPRLCNADAYKESDYVELEYDIVKYEYIKNKNELYAALYKTFNTTESSLVTNVYLKKGFLDFNGYPRPIKRWMIDGAWDIFKLYEVYS